MNTEPMTMQEMAMPEMTMQDVLRNEALKITKEMTLEEVTCYADQVLAIARERAQKEVEQADEVLRMARRLREYAEAIGR